MTYILQGLLPTPEEERDLEELTRPLLAAAKDQGTATSVFYSGLKKKNHQHEHDLMHL